MIHQSAADKSQETRVNDEEAMEEVTKSPLDCVEAIKSRNSSGEKVELERISIEDGTRFGWNGLISEE